MLKIIYIKELKELLKEKRTLLMIVISSIIMIYLPYKIFVKFGDNEQFLQKAIDFYFTFYSNLVVLFLAYSANYNVFLQD